MSTFFKYHFVLLLLVVLFLVASCKEQMENIILNDLRALPMDSGGEQKAEYLDPDKNIYGHYSYLPGGYKENGPAYPLIVFLHGSGEKGNSQNNPDELVKVLRNGPPRLIKDNKWASPFPAIVVSPQCHDNWWNPDKIHEFITYIVKKYNINESRIYLTGLSMGGFGTFSYIEKYGDLGYVAAAIPICGGGNPNKAEAFANLPLWAFHGDADKTVVVQKSIEMVEAINKATPKYKAKLTIYSGVKHDSWTMTYDGSGMGKESQAYDPFNEDIYSWLFKYSKKPVL